MTDDLPRCPTCGDHQRRFVPIACPDEWHDDLLGDLDNWKPRGLLNTVSADTEVQP